MSERESSQGAPQDVAHVAGRGGLAVAGAKAYFILIGFVQQSALLWVLGERYGALASAMSVGTIVYGPLLTLSIQGTSRAVAGTVDAERPAATRRVLSLHAVIAVGLGAAFFAAAGPVGRGFGMPHVVPALRILSAIVLLYGLYAPLIGVLNGRQRFLAQAGFDTLAATLRTAGLVGGAFLVGRALGAPVEGALLGFVLATVVVLSAAFGVVGVGQAGPGGPTVREHLAFIGPLALGQVLLNLLLQADLLVLRFFAGRAALGAGLPPEAADPLVAAYRAMQLFGFLPYQLLVSVSFVLFPLLAAAHRDGNRDGVREYVMGGVRLALIVAGALVSVTSGLAGVLLGAVFPPAVAVLAAGPMQLLSLGLGCFALFGIFTTVLNSLGREVEAMLVTVVAFGAVLVAATLRLQGVPLGGEQIWRVASGTSVGIVVATVAAAVLVLRRAGGVVRIWTLVRVLAALGAGLAVAHVLPELGARGLVGLAVATAYAAVVGAVYLLVLVLSREVGLADVALVRRVVGRGRG